ncbi:MAG: hypothetical protein QW051_00830, partial [Candidatus Aenigmatarchaeota archaeon]
MPANEVIIACPFCGKEGVSAFYKPSYLQARTSRISSGAKTKYYRVPETYIIESDCPHCGAKKKGIQDFFDGKYKKKISHEERI